MKFVKTMLFGFIALNLLIPINVAAINNAVTNPSFECGTGGDACNWLGTNARKTNAGVARTGSNYMDLRNGDAIYISVWVDSDVVDSVTVYWASQDGNLEVRIAYQYSGYDYFYCYDTGAYDACSMTSGFDANDHIQQIAIFAQAGGLLDDVSIIY